MAGVMGTNKMFPFIYKNQSDNDLNKMLNEGYYRLAGSSYTNSPASTMYGLLMVIRDNQSYGTQICFNSYKGETYIRGFVYNDGTFYEWQRIDNFGYNSLADLASGVAGVMGLYYHQITVQSNEPAKFKLSKFSSTLLISDASYGSSALLLKRGKTLTVVSQNLPAGESLEFSVDSDELTLNILYSQRSSGLRIVEI